MVSLAVAGPLMKSVGHAGQLPNPAANLPSASPSGLLNQFSENSISKSGDVRLAITTRQTCLLSRYKHT